MSPKVHMFFNDIFIQVKEKEVAHKEYEAAIEAGHGAYLMDQEKAVSCLYSSKY